MTEQLSLDRIRDLVTILARNHTENVWTGETIVALDRGPLIADLRAEIRTDMGGTGNGRAAAHTRVPISLDVFTMYEDITGRIDAFYRAVTGNHPRATAEETLNAWYVAYRAFCISGKFDEAAQRRTEQQLRSFITRIQSQLDPPRIKELEGECPMEACGLSHTKSREGSPQSALYASYRAGEQPVIRCRGCGTEWAGDRSLLEMGYYLRANVDHDALRSMGVIA